MDYPKVVFACGCEIQRKKTKFIRTRKNGVVTYALICPEHREVALHKLNKCCDCGEIFEMKLRATRQRCASCTDKHEKGYYSEYRETIQNKQRQKIAEFKPRDVSHLITFHGKPDPGKSPCFVCDVRDWMLHKTNGEHGFDDGICRLCGYREAYISGIEDQHVKSYGDYVECF